MKICILSDSHDRGPMMARAVGIAMDEGAEAVIHCGDIIGGNTLRASIKLGLPIHAVHGNNLGDPVSIARLAHHSDGMLHYHGADAAIQLGGRRIFLTHALVRGELETRGAFHQANRALFDEVAVLRDKARRSDMLADDQALFDFFDLVVPADVTNGKELDAWRATAEAADPRCHQILINVCSQF